MSSSHRKLSASSSPALLRGESGRRHSAPATPRSAAGDAVRRRSRCDSPSSLILAKQRGAGAVPYRNGAPSVTVPAGTPRLSTPRGHAYAPPVARPSSTPVGSSSSSSGLLLTQTYRGTPTPSIVTPRSVTPRQEQNASVSLCRTSMASASASSSAAAVTQEDGGESRSRSSASEKPWLLPAARPSILKAASTCISPLKRAPGDAVTPSSRGTSTAARKQVSFDEANIVSLGTSSHRIFDDKALGASMDGLGEWADTPTKNEPKLFTVRTLQATSSEWGSDSEWFNAQFNLPSASKQPPETTNTNTNNTTSSAKNEYVSVPPTAARGGTSPRLQPHNSNNTNHNNNNHGGAAPSSRLARPAATGNAVEARPPPPPPQQQQQQQGRQPSLTLTIPPPPLSVVDLNDTSGRRGASPSLSPSLRDSSSTAGSAAPRRGPGGGGRSSISSASDTQTYPRPSLGGERNNNTTTRGERGNASAVLLSPPPPPAAAAVDSDDDDSPRTGQMLSAGERRLLRALVRVNEKRNASQAAPSLSPSNGPSRAGSAQTKLSPFPQATVTGGSRPEANSGTPKQAPSLTPRGSVSMPAAPVLSLKARRVVQHGSAPAEDEGPQLNNKWAGSGGGAVRRSYSSDVPARRVPSVSLRTRAEEPSLASAWGSAGSSPATRREPFASRHAMELPDRVRSNSGSGRPATSGGGTPRASAVYAALSSKREAPPPRSPRAASYQTPSFFMTSRSSTCPVVGVPRVSSMPSSPELLHYAKHIECEDREDDYDYDDEEQPRSRVPLPTPRKYKY